MRVGDGTDADGDALADGAGLELAAGVGVLSGVFVVGRPAGGGTAGMASTGGGADRRTCGRAWVGCACVGWAGPPPVTSGAVTAGPAAPAAAAGAGGGVRSAVRLPATARYVPAAPPATSSATPLVAATRRGRRGAAGARCRGANSAVSCVSSCASFRRLTCRYTS
ncbi:hypothetical protein Daura_42880 [Dactylosporangium aurantiacum]|uniref:Uncharacterized protein n=1 Tax=Dactylosporangium aurantiacum TaxID=35754 RepID=A0A9Q9MBS5_9ACTN|nr:hypothetical protein [Dactylosporangium aurantiacum]MDG6102475.1 hypothetical protein [Dactylosporangium aurantiacum]UWZ53243.1 hypothetical protein Daura_42880 [Dactylosporangium aurantiacum]